MQTSLARGTSQPAHWARDDGTPAIQERVQRTGLYTRHCGANRARAREQCYTCSFELHVGGASVPLYEYKCLKCGRNTEKIENVAGPHLKKCPHCGGKVESVITAPSIQFKGAGWYVTDYGGKSRAPAPATATKRTSQPRKQKNPGAKIKIREARIRVQKILKRARTAKRASPRRRNSASERSDLLRV